MQPDTLHRRTVLAAAVATMAGGCVPSPAFASSSPDAELIRLGLAFALAFDEWQQANGIWRGAHREALASLASLASHRAGADAASLAAFSRAYDASPARPASAANDAALDSCDALADQIRAIRPTTLAGLAVHAKVARFIGTTAEQGQAQRNELDLEVATFLDFLDLVEGLAS